MLPPVSLRMPEWILKRLCCKRHFGLNHVPISIKFLGHNHGDTGVRPLAKIRLTNPNGYSIIRCNLYKGMRLESYFRASLRR